MTMPAQMSSTVETLPAVERITLHTPAAIIEGPARLGPVADPGAVRAAVIFWAGALYAADPAKRAWMDAHVLQTDTHVLQTPADAAKGGRS